MCIFLREILTESYVFRKIRSTCERHFKIVITLAAGIVLFTFGSVVATLFLPGMVNIYFHFTDQDTETKGGQISCCWLVLGLVIKCPNYFTAQLGWQCFLISNVCNWEIRKYTSDYIRNPKIFCSSSDFGLSPVSYLIYNQKNPHMAQGHSS